MFLLRSMLFKKNGFIGTRIYATKFPRSSNVSAKKLAETLLQDIPEIDARNLFKAAKKWLIMTDRKVDLPKPKALSSMNTTMQYGTASGGGDKPSRPVRGEPGKVHLGMIPVEWVQYFYGTTGVTGFYTFFFTYGIYLISKEKFVMEHEYYTALATVVFWICAAKFVGPSMAKWLDKEIDVYESQMNFNRTEELRITTESIENEKKDQLSMEGQLILLDAKRENVALQLELAFRKRQMMVFSDIIQRLEFQVIKQYIERRIAHHNIMEWTIREVKKAITPEYDKIYQNECIDLLAELATKNK